MIRPVAVYGHPILRAKASEIKGVNESIVQLIKDMWATMYRCDGIGLAAPQVGKALRLFVIDADVFKDEYPELKGFKKVFVNARLETLQGRTCSLREGCLSLPGIHEKVTRPNRIRICYYDEDFNYHSEEYEGFIARIIQHEYDHIEGKLFIDYLYPIKKRLLRSKLSAISSGKQCLNYKTISASKVR